MKQLNNKTLFIILLVLVAAFILTKVFRSPHLETNLKTNLFQVDTALVTKIKIHPHRQPGPAIALSREGNQWNVTQGQKTAKAETGMVHDLLISAANVNVKRMVSRKKDDWNNYGVGDTSGTHVTIYDSANPLADFWIGGTGTGPYRQNTSYIRLNDHKEVYEAAAGYLASSFDKSYDDWRDHTFLRMDKNNITQIIFQYPADSGFTAQKKNTVWMIGNQQADSAKMSNYLDELQSKNLFTFADNFSPVTDPDIVITIDNDTVPISVIKAWKKEKEWILTSTLRKGIYFSSKGSSIIKDLLVGKKNLLGNNLR